MRVGEKHSAAARLEKGGFLTAYSHWTTPGLASLATPARGREPNDGKNEKTRKKKGREARGGRPRHTYFGPIEEIEPVQVQASFFSFFFFDQLCATFFFAAADASFCLC